MDAVKFEKHDALGHIILDAAPFNFVGDAYRNELRQAIHDASEAGIRALLISPVGPNFSAGGAVHEWVAQSPYWLRTFLAEVVQSYRSLEMLPFPVVASVRGAASGGGLELALACDFIIASDTTVLWSPEIMGGAIPLAGGVPRLVRRIGRAKALRMTMLGEKTPIAEVPDFADHIVADDELDQFAVQFATRLSNGPTKAYAATKALLKAYEAGGLDGADRLLEDLTTHLFATQDARIGMAGFIPVYAQLASPGFEPPPGGVELPQAAFTGT